MSRLFTPSKGVNLLATELLRKPSRREQLLGQALGQRGLLTTATLPLLVNEVLRQPPPPQPTGASAAFADPAAPFMAARHNRWHLALDIVSSQSLRRSGVRIDPDLWGTIEGATPNAEAKAKCTAVLKALYRPTSSSSSSGGKK